MIDPQEFFALLVLAFTVYKFLAFLNNIRLARKTGLPYTFSPLHELEIWAYITGPVLRWKYARYLMKDQGWPRWARFMVKDWMYEDKGRAHREFGDVFLVVAPGGIVCYIADASSAMSVCSRRKDFIKPPEKMKLLEPFGPNVVSTEGELWRFHVRITLPPFGEAVNRLVWSESFRQTKLLTASWASTGSGDLKTDVYSLTVNVMSCAGFGQQADWTDDLKSMPAGHDMTLVNSIYGVVAYLPHILLLPKWLLRWSPWKRAYQSYVEFDRYIQEFLATERTRLAEDSNYQGNMKGNLLTAVVKSNSNHEKTIGLPGVKSALTDDEILGNLFIFLLAGYDTTANTMIYSTIVLALFEPLQNAIIQEIDQIYEEAAKAGRTELLYSEDLPKFRYVLAFMYEIMRVFPIVLPIGRMTTQAQELEVESSSNTKNDVKEGHTANIHMLPAQCGVIVNNCGIHHSHKYWPHPHIIEPRRWLSSNPNTWDPTCIDSNDVNLDSVKTSNRIPSHLKGTFLTFSEGPRACLGRRFAQTEFIAFFAGLLRQHRIRLGGTVPAAEVERTLRLRSGGSPVTLVPPEDVKLYLTPR